MTRLLITVALLAASPSAAQVTAGEPVLISQCVTTCGLRTKAAHDCTGFQAAETKFLQALATEVPGWTYERTCAAVNGWRVFVHPYDAVDFTACKQGFRILGVNGCLAGYTHHRSREIEVDSGVWADEVLPHELVHALQITLGEPVGHCYWAERGILRAMKHATGWPHGQKHAECAALSELPTFR